MFNPLTTFFSAVSQLETLFAKSDIQNSCRPKGKGLVQSQGGPVSDSHPLVEEGSGGALGRSLGVDRGLSVVVLVRGTRVLEAITNHQKAWKYFKMLATGLPRLKCLAQHSPAYPFGFL